MCFCRSRLRFILLLVSQQGERAATVGKAGQPQRTGTGLSRMLSDCLSLALAVGPKVKGVGWAGVGGGRFLVMGGFVSQCFSQVGQRTFGSVLTSSGMG